MRWYKSKKKRHNESKGEEMRGMSAKETRRDEKRVMRAIEKTREQ